MEFGERKRRRKSQSFKVVNDEDFVPTCLVNSSCTYANGESAVGLLGGDESMEIKRQITGMMRLLNDKAGRVYHRMGTEEIDLKKQPKDEHINWGHKPPILSPYLEDHQGNNWNPTEVPGPSTSSSTPISNGQGYSQYCTRSNAIKTLNNNKDPKKTNEAIDEAPPAVQEVPCCMCNCKTTLQAILQELRAMRRLMQAQKASLEKQEQTSPSQSLLGPCSAPRRRPRKRRPSYRIASLSASSRKATVSPLPPNPIAALPLESGRREELERERDSSTPTLLSSEASSLPALNNPIAVNDTRIPLLSQLRGPQSLESEVRLAEDYDVFISKTQLDSILVNYTRSGSLLFRKLVCAFFDDAILANSLPNGKRKRGHNDNRKGLDQNIVGAIKVFTEKYCNAHRIEKLPGPRDWVQILQDQIKLARRRLKRDTSEVTNGPYAGSDSNMPGNVAKALKNETG